MIVIFLRVMIVCSILLLSGCMTAGSLVSTGFGVGTTKYGWFDNDSIIIRAHQLKIPKIPYNLSLRVRYIFQGVDCSAKGVLEDSLEWVFLESLQKQIENFLTSKRIALINDRGHDGHITIEISNRIEALGQRYIPFFSAIRLTEKKIGKIRVTLSNSKGEIIQSNLLEENLYIQSGLFGDSILDKNKQAVFEVPRTEYTVYGETVGLEELNQQLLIQALNNIQGKIDLDYFFDAKY